MRIRAARPARFWLWGLGALALWGAISGWTASSVTGAESATPSAADSSAKSADSSASAASGTSADSSNAAPAGAAGAPAAADSSKPKTAPPKPAAPVGDPAIGKKIFVANKCATCHKVDGSGGFKLSGNPTPNWRDAKRMSDPKYGDDYLRECIMNGRPKSGMPSWGKSGVVKSKDIVHVIAYIHTFSAPKK